MLVRLPSDFANLFTVEQAGTDKALFGSRSLMATTLDSDDPTGCQLQRTSEDEADSVNVPSSSLTHQIYQ